MSLNITIELPSFVQQQMERRAQAEARSVADLIRELVLQNWQTSPRLPDDVETELAALPNLSDEALWVLARTTLTAGEQNTLATLNHKAKTTKLTSAEEARLTTLLDLYDRALVRRAQAAVILQHRGYNLQNPAVLQ
jgi:hypothetical protein